MRYLAKSVIISPHEDNCRREIDISGVASFPARPGKRRERRRERASSRGASRLDGRKKRGKGEGGTETQSGTRKMTRRRPGKETRVSRARPRKCFSSVCKMRDSLEVRAWFPCVLHLPDRETIHRQPCSAALRAPCFLTAHRLASVLLFRGKRNSSPSLYASLCAGRIADAESIIVRRARVSRVSLVSCVPCTLPSAHVA